MKRSQINSAIKSAKSCFEKNGWVLPPNAKWDVTDFGLRDFDKSGLLLINLAEEPEYCEKLMYARKNQETPSHCHKKKKEDIICRQGKLVIEFWNSPGDSSAFGSITVKVNGENKVIQSGDKVILNSGERVTISPLVYHAFHPESEECIIGEVSTANDDLNDNFFVNEEIGRYPEVEEDEPALIRLLSDK